MDGEADVGAAVLLQQHAGIAAVEQVELDRGRQGRGQRWRGGEADAQAERRVVPSRFGGPDEAEAARWCKDNMKKPIVGFIAGVTAPPGKRMGHAGALISGGADTADAKLAIMEECGFTITRNPSEMGRLLKGLL